MTAAASADLRLPNVGPVLAASPLAYVAGRSTLPAHHIDSSVCYRQAGVDIRMLSERNLRLVDDAGEDFEAALRVAEEVVRYLARRRHCSADEAEEFGSAARLHLVEADFRVLRLHQGRSSLRTYLTVVLDRLLVDLRRRRWGVWRPSAEARRLGPAAVKLDQLLHRDGLGLQDAIETLRTNEGLRLEEREWATLAARLPVRTRRREVGPEALAELCVPASTVEANALANVREERRARLRVCLRAALDGLSDEDCLILRLRFGQALTVASIAASLGLEAKGLYRRFEGLLRRLRCTLEDDGFDAAETAELIERSAWDHGPEVLP